LPSPSYSDTIAYSREWITEGRIRGVRCPTCDRTLKEHHLAMGKSMALILQTMHGKHGTDWFNAADLRNDDDTGFVDSNHIVSKMARWEIVRQHPNSKRSGSWGVTPLGERWIKGEANISEGVALYQGELVAKSKETISFKQIVEEDATRTSHKLTYQPANQSIGIFRTEDATAKKARIYTPTVSTPDEIEGPLSELHVARRETPALDPKVYRGKDSIGAARSWMRKRLKRGVYCPTCDRIAAYHKYPLTDSLARLMVEIYKRRHTESPIQPTKITLNKKLVDRNHQAYMLVRRELLKSATRPKGATSGNWYEITPEGKSWVRNETCTAYLLTSYNRYGDDLQDEYDEQVSIEEVFAGSARWDYAELMHRIDPGNNIANYECFLLDLDVDSVYDSDDY
jgi:hypothetical protein